MRESWDRRLDRLLQLARWLRGLGVCDGCARMISIAQIERECGETHLSPGWCGRSGRLPTCRGIAIAHWQELPAAEAIKFGFNESKLPGGQNNDTDQL